ncbi:NUDIX hydrolase N-terminal domain-containing protein [Mucilaginibacter kameinonensis]|uniref:NUDIX hydrolase N-terminal domain-containing protein n=1 Tax=Mucilaginibacter kameinonensis TaxID=452286 RepID=UPI001ABFE85B|nr:NUDIX hydrolase N-terminal domain-containing protein [Mucilaginibacter kameinonensis]
MPNTNLLSLITQLRSVADTGLLYAKNEYDIERYQELQHLSTKMFEEVSGYGTETINLLFHKLQITLPPKLI